MSNKKFISARPDRNHNEASSGSYTVGTSIHLAASRQRQANLETYSYHLTKEENLSVYVVDSEQDVIDAGLGHFLGQIRLDTAQILQSEEFDETIVIIPAYSDLENPFDTDNVSDEEFRSIIQYANALHETGGHYQHTDQPSVNRCFQELQDYVSGYPKPVQKMLLELCKDLWNAIEDGAIEEAIRNERGSKAAQRLAVKNETFIARGVKTYPADVKENVSLELALHLASMDLAKYDTGSLRRLLDSEDDSWQFKDEEHKEAFFDIYDELRQTVEDTMVTANPAARTHRIFDFLETVVDVLTEKFPDPDEQDQQSREKLRENQKDDSQNQSGKPQQQQSQGLQDNSEDDVAQQHANVTQQTVERNSDDEDSNGDDGQADDRDADSSNTDNGNPEEGVESDSSNQQSGDQQSGDDSSDQGGELGDEASDGSESGQSGDSSESGEVGEDGDVSDGSEPSDGDTQGQDGAASENGPRTGDSSGDNADNVTEPDCPSCGSSETGRLVQDVDGMIAARVNAPFDITASWVGNITFVSNDDVCGFRVDAQGSVPRQQIEQNGYKVVDVSGSVEILELRENYSDIEQVRGFDCDSCGHEWVPTIGGDSE